MVLSGIISYFRVSSVNFVTDFERQFSHIGVCPSCTLQIFVSEIVFPRFFPTVLVVWRTAQPGDEIESWKKDKI